MRLQILGFEINKPQIIGVGTALTIIILGLIFIRGTDLFYFLLGVSFFIAGFPFFISLILESRTSKEKERMFLEFARDLVESVKAGTPISRSILNVRGKNYGSLSPYTSKLANQIALGIPLKNAFETFARDVNSNTISRSVNIISESEKAGGQISDILESVVKSVTQIEKLRKERASAIYTLVVQGYIIFLIFLVIMVVMEFQILPIASTLSGGMSGVSETGLAGVGGFGTGGTTTTSDQLAKPFLWLLIVQGFFAGLVIGKLSEGTIRSGLKHSFILVVLAVLFNTGARLFLGGGG